MFSKGHFKTRSSKVVVWPSLIPFLHSTMRTMTRMFVWCLILNLLSSAVMSISVPKNIVIVGGGIQGTSVAYHLALGTTADSTSITILESEIPASAASGKGGGFMARSWGDGSPTQTLHHLAFDMYEKLAPQLGCTSYRKIPVLSVSPGGGDGIARARKSDKKLAQVLPGWLDGKVGRISAMGWGEDTAQITPKEFVMAMLKNQEDRIKVLQGATCTGVETEQGSEPDGNRKVMAIKYTTKDKKEELVLPADCVVVSAGPWSCAAEDWFPGAVTLPMEGVKVGLNRYCCILPYV
jgi:glycine/D-amino acid oxidase-like deaminating enzyme